MQTAAFTKRKNLLRRIHKFLKTPYFFFKNDNQKLKGKTVADLASGEFEAYDPENSQPDNLVAGPANLLKVKLKNYTR